MPGAPESRAFSGLTSDDIIGGPGKSQGTKNGMQLLLNGLLIIAVAFLCWAAVLACRREWKKMVAALLGTALCFLLVALLLHSYANAIRLAHSIGQDVRTGTKAGMN